MELASCEEPISKNEKICIDCKTSKTPLWRSGPAGPKSLCNACGIRFRKKRSVVGSDKKREKQPPQPSPESSSSSTAACTTGSRNRVIDNNSCGFDMKKGGKLRKNLRINLVALGKEVVLLQRPRSPMKKVKRQKMHQIENQYMKFGEVEQAAFLLMSLSCGSVFG